MFVSGGLRDVKFGIWVERSKCPWHILPMYKIRRLSLPPFRTYITRNLKCLASWIPIICCRQTTNCKWCIAFTKGNSDDLESLSRSFSTAILHMWFFLPARRYARMVICYHRVSVYSSVYLSVTSRSCTKTAILFLWCITYPRNCDTDENLCICNGGLRPWRCAGGRIRT